MNIGACKHCFSRGNECYWDFATALAFRAMKSALSAVPDVAKTAEQRGQTDGLDHHYNPKRNPSHFLGGKMPGPFRNMPNDC